MFIFQTQVNEKHVKLCLTNSDEITFNTKVQNIKKRFKKRFGEQMAFF